MNKCVVRSAWCVGALLLAACKARDVRPEAGASSSSNALRTTHYVPEVRLTEYGGRVFDLAAQRGNVVLLFFGYTRCPDVCPTTLADFQGVHHRLGPRADHVRFVFISVDPRDTPQQAAQYARGFDRSFIGLTGDSATIARVERGFGAASYVEKDSAGEVSVAHSASVFVIGKDGTVTETLRFAGPQEDALYELADTALQEPAPAQLSPRDPWVRTQTDISGPAAAYISLDNPGPLPIVVRSASCTGVRMASIHQSVQSGGMMRMSALDTIVVPTAGKVAMAPGGIHLMLQGLQRPLAPGDHLDCTLRTSAGDVAVSAPVRDR